MICNGAASAADGTADEQSESDEYGDSHEHVEVRNRLMQQAYFSSVARNVSLGADDDADDFRRHLNGSY